MMRASPPGSAATRRRSCASSSARLAAPSACGETTPMGQWLSRGSPLAKTPMCDMKEPGTCEKKEPGTCTRTVGGWAGGWLSARVRGSRLLGADLAPVGAERPGGEAELRCGGVDEEGALEEVHVHVVLHAHERAAGGQPALVVVDPLALRRHEVVVLVGQLVPVHQPCAAEGGGVGGMGPGASVCCRSSLAATPTLRGLASRALLSSSPRVGRGGRQP